MPTLLLLKGIDSRLRVFWHRWGLGDMLRLHVVVMGSLQLGSCGAWLQNLQLRRHVGLRRVSKAIVHFGGRGLGRWCVRRVAWHLETGVGVFVGAVRHAVALKF